MIKKKAFVSYKLEEERNKKSVVIPVRVNIEEQELIKAIKECLNIHSDSKALKVSARIGLDVLQHTFNKKTLIYLCSEKRERLSDYKDFLSQK